MKQVPISNKKIVRFCVFLLVILAISAGYFASQLTAERRKYNLLEDRYVRVRAVLGREETQRLIDQSHEMDEISEDW